MMGRKGADKGYLEKLTRDIPLTVDAQGLVAGLGLSWLATGASGQGGAFFTGGLGNLDT
jgi:hypothetical protein